MPYKLSLDVFAGALVYLIAVYVSVAVYYVVLAGEVNILRLDMELVRLPFVSPELAAEVFVRGVNNELIGDIGIVSETVIEIIVHYGSTCAEGYGTVKIGEKVYLVMMMMLCDGKLGMEYHPVDKVRHLAHTAAETGGGVVGEYGKTFAVALFLCEASDKIPEREGLSRADKYAVYLRSGKGKVYSLVLLKLHIHVAEPSANKGIVLVDNVFKLIL